VNTAKKPLDIAHISPAGKPLTTLQRGLRMLETIAQDRGQMTAKKLAQLLDIRLGTCYHLLRTLQEEGYIVRLRGGRYELNGRVAYLQDSLRAQLTPDLQILLILRRLHERVNVTTCVCGWHSDQIVLRWYLEPVRAVHARSLQIGYQDHPHARASTRAILAYLPEERVRAYFAERILLMLTQRTLTDIDELLHNLEQIARDGYCVDHEELAKGMCCIGAPYFDERGFPVGAYGISLPANEFEDASDTLISEVVSAAKETSRSLGYEGNYPPISALTAPAHRGA